MDRAGVDDCRGRSLLLRRRLLLRRLQLLLQRYILHSPADDVARLAKRAWQRREAGPRRSGGALLFALCQDRGGRKGLTPVSESKDFSRDRQSDAKTVHELNGADLATLSDTIPVPYQYRTSSRTGSEASFRVEGRPSHPL